MAVDEDLDLENIGVLVSRHWLQRRFFWVALLISWVLHGGGLIWLGGSRFEPKPEPMKYLPVQLIHLPPAKKIDEPPKKADALAAENQVSTATQEEKGREEPPPPQPAPVVSLPVPPPPDDQDLKSREEPLPPQPAPDLPSPPVEPRHEEPVLPKPAPMKDLPAPPSVQEKSHPPPPPKKANAVVQPVVKPQPVIKTPKPVSVKRPLQDTVPAPAKPVSPAKPAPQVVQPPVTDRALPNLSLNPSLGEMARWDQERHKREQEEVYKRQEETVSLNTQKIRYAAYFGRLKERIQQGWVYPSEAKKANMFGSLAMRFTINRNGTITDIKVLSTSGALVLDEAAVQAVTNVNPFIPFPEDWDLEKLHVKTIFEYVRGGFRWGQ